MQVTVGFDAIQHEAFLSYHCDEDAFVSLPGLRVDDLQTLVVEQLGVTIPQPVIDAVHKDVADLRLGAADLNRRIYQYAADGTLLQQHRW